MQRCIWLVIFILFVVPLFAQTIGKDQCTTFTMLTGTFSFNGTPEACWHITPHVGASKRPTTISIRFTEFDLGTSRVTVYTATSVDDNQQFGVFSGDQNPFVQEGGSGAVFDVVSTSVLFLYLQGDDYCEFTFEWVTGKELEIKTALLVLISVIIMLIIPLICVRVVISTQGKKITQRQLEQADFGTTRRVVALWSGILLGFLIMVLILSRKLG